MKSAGAISSATRSRSQTSTSKKGLVDQAALDALFGHRLVPLWRGPAGLVVAMPGTASEPALEALAKQAGCSVYAGVGSVRGNRRWLEESLPPAPLPGEDKQDKERWSLLFDVGDARARETFGG